MNEIRIIAGQLRGRRIQFHPSHGLRPTLDAVRETLFNWLMFKIKHARCLDAFAGSGALGFEGLSRFAETVTFIEYDKDALAYLKKNAHAFNVAEQMVVQQDSALHYLAKATVIPFDLIFLDPPFSKDLLLKSLELIQERKWLKQDGFIYFEAERQLDLASLIDRSYRVYRHKVLGEVQFGLLEVK